MARSYEEYGCRGARIVAIVTDRPRQNAAMVEKLLLPFPILSDPDGETACKPYGVWDDEEQMALPAIVMLDQCGRDVFRYVGRDFVDRPTDEAILDALGSLSLPPVSVPSEAIATVDPSPGRSAMGINELGAYLSGVRYTSEALAGRARDDYHRHEAERTVAMAKTHILAHQTTRRLARTRARANPSPAED
jgi:hypothetical protein